MGPVNGGRRNTIQRARENVANHAHDTRIVARANPAGCAQARLLAGELSYLIRNPPVARQELQEGFSAFEKAGDLSGMAETNLTGAHGEKLSGNLEFVEPALRDAEDSVGERPVPADQVGVLVAFYRRFPTLIQRADPRPIEQRLADARELHRWAWETGDPSFN